MNSNLFKVAMVAAALFIAQSLWGNSAKAAPVWHGIGMDRLRLEGCTLLPFATTPCSLAVKPFVQFQVVYVSCEQWGHTQIIRHASRASWTGAVHSARECCTTPRPIDPIPRNCG